MKKFLLQQQVGKLQFTKNCMEFSSLLHPCNNAKGSLKIESASPGIVVKFNILAESNLETLQGTYNNIYFSVEKGIDLLPKVYEKVLSVNQANNIKQLYSLLYPNYGIKNFSFFYEESNSATLFGETYNSVNSRTNKNSVYIANWLPNLDSSFSKQVCQIQFF